MEQVIDDSTALDIALGQRTKSTTPPSATRFGACLLFVANALARSVTGIADSEFAKMGLSYSHAYLLSEIVLNPGSTPTYLSEILFLSPSTITRLIEKLEHKGLARRETGGKNTMVFATEAGASLAPAVTEAWQTNWTKFTDKLGEDDALALTKQIFSALEQLNADPAEVD